MIRTILAAILLSTSPAAAQTFAGVASVIDGDTIEIHGQRIRIHGVDAPESYQLCYSPAAYRCGQHAALALSDHLQRTTVTCTATSRDRYKRVVARCTVAGQDIALWLVSQGHALDWPRYSKGEYAPHQERARARGKGIWASRFALPWERRKDKNAELVN